MIILNADTDIISEVQSGVLQKAMDRMRRDLNMTLQSSAGESSSILLRKAAIGAELFEIRRTDKDIVIQAEDELGFIYGLLYISEQYLGIRPFWFWNNQKFKKKECVMIEDVFYQAGQPRIRFRGWFINDEVLIDQWQPEGSPELPWEMALEALLRCGGNMVVPGTDKNAGKYADLASDMGLWVTHHHAEPLGAEMFARAYPDLEPSYKKYPELFRKLWRDGIQAQKHKKIIWNLGFRGQGDYPFWLNDPEYDTEAARGALISQIMKEQYELLKEAGLQPVCCTNLYGEIMELYKGGYLEFPHSCIAIWADNGYGKMVSRRQEKS